MTGDSLRKSRKPAGRAPSRTQPPRPVTVTKVNPGVWATALAAAGGDPRLITVVSATKVIVFTANHGAES